MEAPMFDQRVIRGLAFFLCLGCIGTTNAESFNSTVGPDLAGSRYEILLQMHSESSPLLLPGDVLYATNKTGAVRIQDNVVTPIPIPEGAEKSDLVVGLDGFIYGTSHHASNKLACGTIFKISPTLDVTIVHQFLVGEGKTYGCNPRAGLTLGPDGRLYGLTKDGGGYKGGTLFAVNSNGSLDIIHNFNENDAIGGHSIHAVVMGGDGRLYGKNYKSLFWYDFHGGVGVLRVLDGTDNSFASRPLTDGGDGFLYGASTTRIYKISYAGDYMVVHDFNSMTEGSNVSAGLTIDGDGTFLGVLGSGGEKGGGSLFRMTRDGKFTLLRAFNCYGVSGCRPRGSVSIGTGGYLFGSTSYARGNQNGTLYKFLPLR
jgi:hypothetical protein